MEEYIYTHGLRGSPCNLIKLHVLNFALTKWNLGALGSRWGAVAEMSRP